MKKSIIIFVIFFTSLELYSQDVNKFSLWGSIGGGLSFISYSNGSGGFSINYGIYSKLNIWVLAVKHRESSEFTMADGPNEEFNSTSLLFGISNNLYSSNNQVTAINFNALIGVSYLGYHQQVEVLGAEINDSYYFLDKTTSVGFPIEVEFEFKLLKYVGIAVSLNSNINSIKNTFGLNVNFIFGYL